MRPDGSREGERSDTAYYSTTLNAMRAPTDIVPAQYQDNRQLHNVDLIIHLAAAAAAARCLQSEWMVKRTT